MTLRNFSPSCERNKAAILAELKRLFGANTEHSTVLEIGSYSGQHAIHFSEHLPQLVWQPTDLSEHLASLQYNLTLYHRENCLSAKELDVSQPEHWPNNPFDFIFTANTLHIMPWQHVEHLFNNLSHVSDENTQLAVYGPFKYQGEYTSASNEEFEYWLKDRDQRSGIRDFEAVDLLAKKAGFTLKHDIAMPANNQLIVWQKLL